MLKKALYLKYATLSHLQKLLLKNEVKWCPIVCTKYFLRQQGKGESKISQLSFNLC